MNTIKVKISDDDLYNILDAAFYSGISYWCDLVEVINPVQGAKYLGEHVTGGGTLKLQDDDGGSHWLTKAKMLKGLSLYDNHDFDSFDAGDADCVVQLALFGQIIYG